MIKSIDTSPLRKRTTMSFTISCPTCSKTLNVEARLSGQKVSCPHCKKKFVCSAAPAPAPAPTPDVRVAAKPPAPAGTAYLGASNDPLQIPKTPPTNSPRQPQSSEEDRSVSKILEDILMVLAEDRDLRMKMLRQMKSAAGSLSLIALPIVISLVGVVIWGVVLLLVSSY